MVHDTAFTERFAIVLDLPVDFDPNLVGKGLPFSWTDQRMPRIGLIPRDGDLSRARWIEAPSCYVFHVMNAFDDGDAVVMDVVRHGRVFDRTRQGTPEADTMLIRWRLELTSGRLTETIIFDRGCEFPRFNDARGGMSYRFGYTIAAGSGGYGPVFKHDLATGRTQVHDFGPGRSSLEPVFVAREGAEAEDDGYLISYVYDQAREASDVVILNAQAFADKALATISLPVRVPYGFHGNWIADQA
jgi:carotenoid cleavage dioxygenase